MSEEKRILQCLNCGQPFEPTCHITRQKFCCDACRHKYNNAKRHYDVPVDICPGCGDIMRKETPSFCADNAKTRSDFVQQSYFHNLLSDFFLLSISVMGEFSLPVGIIGSSPGIIAHTDKKSFFNISLALQMIILSRFILIANSV